MDRPVVVIVDCCRHKSSPSFPSSPDATDPPHRLLRALLGDHQDSSSAASEPSPINMALSSSEQIDIYPLRLETKYYTSEVGVGVLRSPTIGNEEFAKSVEAVILYLKNSDDFAPLLDPWLSFVQHWEETAVKLVACDRAGPLGSKERLSVQGWCVKNEFELVELDPDDETRMEADDCGEVIGVKRIMQALRAHSWSNLDMKDERTMDADRAERLRSYLEEKDREHSSSDLADEPVSTLSNVLNQTSVSDSSAATSSSASAAKAKLHSDVDDLLKTDDQTALFRAINHSSADGGGGGTDPSAGDGANVSFEELFARFAEMKEMAASLPLDQRKAYAEKVTVAFWRSIGGDEDEIDGIGESSSDDDGNDGDPKGL